MLKTFPKVSIITPSFNQSEYLEQTILSVLNQGYPNLEYIIIDGGSTDGSVKIINKYTDKLSFWLSETDKGMYDAINKGFKKCTGEIFLSRLNHYAALRFSLAPLDCNRAILSATYSNQVF